MVTWRGKIQLQLISACGEAIAGQLETTQRPAGALGHSDTRLERIERLKFIYGLEALMCLSIGWDKMYDSFQEDSRIAIVRQPGCRVSSSTKGVDIIVILGERLAKLLERMYRIIGTPEPLGNFDMKMRVWGEIRSEHHQMGIG